MILLIFEKFNFIKSLFVKNKFVENSANLFSKITVDSSRITKVFKMPQIQKRINQIRQQAIGQQQQIKVEPKQQRSRPNPKRDQGLSL